MFGANHPDPTEVEKAKKVLKVRKVNSGNPFSAFPLGRGLMILVNAGA